MAVTKRQTGGLGLDVKRAGQVHVFMNSWPAAAATGKRGSKECGSTRECIEVYRLAYSGE